MGLIIKDRVKDTSTTTGTGDITVSGTAPTGFRAFDDALATSDTSVITIHHQTADEWEICETSYSGSNVLTRGTLLASSTGSRIDFSAGTKDVWIDLAADQVVDLDRPQTLTNKTLTDAIVGTQSAGDNSTKAASTAYVDGAVRKKLTADRTYYVRTDGADTNNGLSNTSGGAFLTIQKAIDTVAALDISIFDVTIQVGAGTYTAANTLKAPLGSGTVTILGDATTPSNVTISTTNQSCINAAGFINNWVLNGLKLTTTTSGHGLRADKGAALVYKNIDFGACVSGHMTATTLATITCASNYAISGGSTRHMWAETGGVVIVAPYTVTISNTPAFSSAFAFADIGGIIQANSNTYSGSATGKRYEASTNGTIFVNTASPNSYLPGDANGSTASGGQIA